MPCLKELVLRPLVLLMILWMMLNSGVLQFGQWKRYFSFYFNLNDKFNTINFTGVCLVRTS